MYLVLLCVLIVYAVEKEQTEQTSILCYAYIKYMLVVTFLVATVVSISREHSTTPQKKLNTNLL